MKPVDSQSKPRILIVDDDEFLRNAVTAILAEHGYWVLAVASGEAAIEKATQEHPHLILLDKDLPDRNGFDVCRKLKEDSTVASIPIIFFSGDAADANVVDGLDLGAADFIAKPVRPKVLLARVRAALRSGGATKPEDAEGDVLILHNLEIDKNRHRVLVDGEDAKLSPTEFKILVYLAYRPGWVFSRQQIVDHLSSGESNVTERSVDVQMAGLRKKLGEKAGSLIETVRGAGYRIRES